MVRFADIPRPVLRVLAVLLAGAASLYSGIWLYYTNWEPEAMLGVDWQNAVPQRFLQITQVIPGSAAEKAGVRVGDRIVAVNGQPIDSVYRFADAVTRGRPGDGVDLTIRRSEEPAPLRLRAVLVPQPKRLLSSAEQFAERITNTYPLWFLGVVLTLLILRYDDRNAWLAALLFVSCMCAPDLPWSFREVHPAVRGFERGFRATLIALLPALFFFFFSVFPVQSQLDRRRPWVKWLVLGVGFPLGLPAGLDWSPGDGGFLEAVAGVVGPRTVSLSSSAYLYSLSSLGLFKLVWGLRGSHKAEARRKMRILVWGTVAGLTPIMISESALTFFGIPTPFWLRFACVLLVALFPLSFAYAVIKHRVMEIPLLLKRSARFAMVRGVFVLAMLALSLWLPWRLATVASSIVGIDTQAALPLAILLGTAFGMIWIVGATHIEQWVQPRIDRAFFRSVYDTKQILQHLAENLPMASSRNELAGMLEQQLMEALHPESLAVYLRATGDSLLLERFTPGPVPAVLESLTTDSPVLLELAHRGRPWEVPPTGVATPPNLPQLGMLRDVLDGHSAPPDRSDVLAQLVPLRPECLVPVMGREHRMAGLLVLGQRLSEEPYSDEDEKLLALVAGQAGVAFENIHMAEQMAARLQAEQKRANEMSIAREVQSKLFPQKMPPLATLDYAGSCEQARTIGGDYYDYLDMGKGRVGLVLADISGKGIFAALLMANLQANLRSQYALALEDLGDLMRSVNRLFYESVTPGLYATLFIADYSDRDRRMRYVNCGHNPPLVLRASGVCEKLGATATVLGLMDVWDCTVGEVHLAPGDILVVYSDGVTEASSDAGDFFGDQRLEDTVRQHQHLSAAELTRKIAATVHTFSGKEQEDDLTLLIARARA